MKVYNNKKIEFLIRLKYILYNVQLVKIVSNIKKILGTSKKIYYVLYF